MAARSYYSIALVIALGVILIYNQRSGNQHRIAENCSAINGMKTTLVVYIDQQLDRAAKSLPGIEYYKSHPVELGRQLAEIERQRQAANEAFAPSSC